jgi:hypothetical protein
MLPAPSVPQGVTLYREPSTKRAAALLTVGVDFFSPRDNERTTNVYDDKRPHRPGMPGNITYLLKDKTDTGVKTSDLAAAYDNAGFEHAKLLDDLVQEICQASPALGARLKTLLPFAIVAYLRGGYENRERILDLWKKALPMVLIRRGENAFTLVHKNAPDHVLRKFGVK